MVMTVVIKVVLNEISRKLSGSINFSLKRLFRSVLTLNREPRESANLGDLLVNLSN